MSAVTPILAVNALDVRFRQDAVETHAVRGVSYELARGETMALVGESGSGKSVTALATVSLLPDSATIAGSILYEGREMVGADEAGLRRVRGNDIAFIFQEPMTSLNPLHTLDKQIGESLLIHQGLTGEAARKRILELLDEVGIPEPETRMKSYPHQLSGGQRQRVMIAMALANNPKLLIADEPTTALDVTIQAQILELLASWKLLNRGMFRCVFMTHDLGIDERRFAPTGSCVMKDGRDSSSGATYTEGNNIANPEHTPTRRSSRGQNSRGAANPRAPERTAPIVARDRKPALCANLVPDTSRASEAHGKVT